MIGSNKCTTIAAIGGGLTHTAIVSLNVLPASSPSFTISTAPQSVTVGPGGSNTANLSVTPVSGFNADVSLSASGLPQGLSASLSQTTISAPGAGASVLTVSADPSATPGTSTLTILASGNGITNSAALTVTVCGVPTPTAPQGLIQTAALREGGTPALLNLRDEDDSQVQIIPSDATLARARLHSRNEICRPLQYSIFLGNGWADPVNRRRESDLAHLKVGLSAVAICGSGGGRPIRAQSREVKGDLVGADSLSDLQIQARLASMFRDGTLPPARQETVYLVFLAPESRSTLESAVGGIRT